MKVLYIFPHPDDESFGPAAAISYQRRQGHEVHLLTLTRGGATKQRHKFGYSVDEMGKVRIREMHRMAEVLNLSRMTILDLPDSGLKEMVPSELEKAIADEIGVIKPDVIVTYAVHGISGFHDHLVSHAAVKSVYTSMQETEQSPSRLAFYTVTEEQAAKSAHFRLSFSREEEIDCIVRVEEEDLETCRRALDCYETYKETIEKTGIKNMISGEVCFEFFREDYTPPVADLFDGI